MGCWMSKHLLEVFFMLFHSSTKDDDIIYVTLSKIQLLEPYP
jgi:hypothetical protein